MKLRSVPFLLILLASPSALAESAQRSIATSENPLLDEARRAFAEGRALMDERRFRDAIEKFRMAAQVKDTPGLRYYIAYCLEQLGELLEARREYAKAAELLAEFEANDVRELLPDAQDRVDRALPRLSFVDTEPRDVIQVDGSVVQPSETLRLNPGRHTVRVLRANHAEREKSLTIARGEAATLSVATVLSSQRPAPTMVPARSSEESDAGGSAKPIFVWSGIGLAAAGIGVGVAGFVVQDDARSQASALREDIKDKTDEPYPCSGVVGAPVECDALTQADARAQVGNALLIGGSIAAAVGVTGALLCHYLWPKSDIQWAVSVAPMGTSFTLRGKF